MSQTQMLLSWDEYQKNICNGLSELQQHGDFVDMTLAADGHHVKVHQLVMSMASPYIRALITSVNCPHPVIFLNSTYTLEKCLWIETNWPKSLQLGRHYILKALEECSNQIHQKQRIQAQ
ncbi:protein bric-a-brac 2-like [Trichoplusia ni]|uniref:Protein bric-a-brac 2-like n=1 Tax=Trichoplusia ni TaxID=7111 RepID=A0A7E5VWQ7_TRINI|nr:protein bric-a-brac 2-like isoform X2 [Trichoplusia ni]XP_026743305.1 protein bric-a-brac 2-like [Trichoplusia ni]